MGYGSLPPSQERFQQHPETGQYQVIAPPQPAPNNGQSGHNPYQFIFEADQVRGGKRGGLMGDAFFKLIALIVGGVVILLVVAALVIDSLAPKGSLPGMIAIAQRQQEIVRVATTANQQATSADVRNFAQNVSLSVSSSQQQISGYATAHGAKLDTKTLALDKSAQTDSQLAAAATANNYDSAAAQDLVSQLQTYEKLLQTTYKQTDSKTARHLLQAAFSSSDLLLQQGQAVEKGFGN